MSSNTREVSWIDGQGWRRASILPSSDTVSPPEAGIPVGPPDLNDVDWESVKRDLHNRFMDGKLYSWSDVQRNHGLFTAALMHQLRAEILRIYRVREEQDE